MVLLYILMAGLAILVCGCSGPEAKSDAVELRMAIWGDPDWLKFLQDELDTSFRKDHPHTRIRLEVIPWSRYFDKILISCAGGKPPDVMALPGQWFVPCVQRGIVEPLDPYMENDGYDIGEFVDPAVQSVTYNGRHYGIPWNLAMAAVCYNKAVFREGGVPYPDENWDFNTYMQAARKLTKDRDGDGKLDQWGGRPLTWQDVVWLNDGNILNEDQTKCTMDRPEAYEAVQLWADLQLHHHLEPSPGEVEQVYSGAMRLFCNNKVAMMQVGPWIGADVHAGNMKGIDYDVAPLPGIKRRASVLEVSCYSILTGSKHKEEAWELVKFMTSPRMLNEWTKRWTIITGRKRISAEAYLSLEGRPESKQIFLDSIQYGKSLPRVGSTREIMDILEREMQLVGVGKKTAKEACEHVTPIVDQLLRQETKRLSATDRPAD